MALLTLKEFAAACGMTTGNLSNEIKRTNVVKSGEYIDDAFDKNANFLRKRLAKARKVKDTSDNPPPPPDTAHPQTAVEPTPKNPNTKVDPKDIDLYNLERQKELLEIEKLTQGNRYLKNKADIAEGKVVDAEGVKLTLLALKKTMQIEYRDKSQNVIDLLVIKCGLSPQEAVDLRKKNIEIINEASSEAIKSAQKDIDNIIELATQKRGVGERA